MRAIGHGLVFSAILQGLLRCLLAGAVEYPHAMPEPQQTGWPLTAEERRYVTERAEHDRRPGRESNQHLPQLWPVVPSAGFFGGDAWLKLHTNAALRARKLDADPAVTVLDLTADFTNADGALKPDLYAADAIHLTPAGYAAYAERLRPLLPKPATARRSPEDTQYLLLNYSTAVDAPHQAREVMGYVRDTFGAANEASRLKVGVAVIYTPRERLAETAERLKADLALAEELDVPLLVQVDTENWLPESLTNWFDPAKPGYDPTKVHDVEWYGWTPDSAVKLCWRNWGRVVRVGPHPNLLSPRFQAWEKSIYEGLAPVVVDWLATLPAEKQWLFVGWKCGWETMPNSQYAFFEDGNAYLDRADDPQWRDEDKRIIGYNAARTGGFQTSGVLDFKQGYDVFMKIVGAHLTFLAATARSLGLPREKLFVHTIAQGVDRFNFESQFNADSNPSPSYYGTPAGSLRDNASFIRCLARGRRELGTTGYGVGEFGFGARDYDPWHRWFVRQLAADPDCIFAALYNEDTMRGQPAVERALLDVMAACPAVSGGDR